MNYLYILNEQNINLELLDNQEYTILHLDINNTNTNSHITVSLKGNGSKVDYRVASYLLNTDKSISINIQTEGVNTSANVESYVLVDDNSKFSIIGDESSLSNSLNSKIKQTTRVVLLADNAKAYCHPILKVSSNNTTGSHANSIGQFPFDQLIYLKSRGLSTSQISTLLKKGFFLGLFHHLDLSNSEVNKMFTDVSSLGERYD